MWVVVSTVMEFSDFEVFKMSEIFKNSFLCGLLLDVKLCNLEFNNVQFGDIL